MPATEAQKELERRAEAACGQADFDAATTHLIEAYGADLLRFLYSRLGDSGAASDVYSEVVERLWTSLPRFEWRHGVRGYCYAIARNAAINYATSAMRRPSRNLPLNGSGNVSAIAEAVRSETLPYLRSEVKDRFRTLRELLPPDDQTLLSLRLDRELEWRELALVMTFDQAIPSDDELEREAARLRQRFKTVKEKLRALAEREGLLDS
jgi:RNA polymerase sigma-70 factor (ECF subfamily)